MKQVYDFEQFIYIKGKTNDFHSTSIWSHLYLLSDEQVMEKENRQTFTDFDSLWNYVNENKVRNADPYKTIFGKRAILFRCGIDYFTIKENKFTEVIIWNHCLLSQASMNTLLKELTADEMAEFLRDRGVNFQKTP